MARVNILKQVRAGKRWRLLSIPRNRKGGYNWRVLPEGRFFIEWYEGGRRRRQAAGVTVPQVLEAVKRKKHGLEATALGIQGYPTEEKSERMPLHLAVKRYLESTEELKKRSTLTKYRTVLRRFL